MVPYVGCDLMHTDVIHSERPTLCRRCNHGRSQHAPVSNWLISEKHHYMIQYNMLEVIFYHCFIINTDYLVRGDTTFPLHTYITFYKEKASVKQRLSFLSANNLYLVVHLCSLASPPIYVDKGKTDMTMIYRYDIV